MQQPARRRSTAPPVETLIRDLREQIETGVHVPGSRVFVDEDRFLRTLDDLRVAYVQAVQEARWVVEQRHDLIAEADAEAQQLVASAQRNVQAMLTDVGVKAAAEERAEEITLAAQVQAASIRDTAWAYALDELTTLAESLQPMAVTLGDARQRLPLEALQQAPQPEADKPTPKDPEPEQPALGRSIRRRRRPRR